MRTELRNAPGEILISISQSNAFAAMVEQGKFASIEDAIAQSSDQLGLIQMGKIRFRLRPSSVSKKAFGKPTAANSSHPKKLTASSTNGSKRSTPARQPSD